ncbi:hypothetical protein ID866_6579 [Astraeus odoratus]|nr:hypothetical protein ID866_6579 [Astraeus odoratus]
MPCLKSTVFASKSLVAFILLSLFIFSASPIHLGMQEMPLPRVLGTKSTKALHNNHLGKRDGSIIVVRIGHFYTTTIYTSDGSAEYDVIIDSGSALTWVGADPNNPYVQGPSSRPLNKDITVVYARGRFEGKAYTDSITLETQAGSDPLTVNSQFIGQATLAAGFPNLLDGILGLGRKEASGMRDKDGNPFPTVLDNLYTQGSIRHAAFGVYFIPVNDMGVGEITFGYTNDAVITSGLNYVPITNVPPASNGWGIDGSVMYDGRLILNPTSGIVDTGGPTISMYTDAIMAYRTATGANVDPQGWLTITQAQYNSLQILSVIIGGNSYDLSPNAQIYPRPTSGSPIRLIIGGISHTRWGFSLGHPFIQRYYVVFNATSSQIGFASTRFTGSTNN